MILITKLVDYMLCDNDIDIRTLRHFNHHMTTEVDPQLPIKVNLDKVCLSGQSIQHRTTEIPKKAMAEI